MLALYPFPISNKNIIIYTSISSFKYIQIRVKSNWDFIIFDKEKSTQVNITLWNYFNTKFQSRINSAKSLSFHKSYLITTLKNTFFGKTKNELRRKRVASSLSLGNSQPVD